MKRPPASERRRSIRVACRFRATAGEVFAAWLDPAIAGQWLFATASHPMAHVDIEPRARGSFRLRDGKGVEYAGEYLEIVPPERLVFMLVLEHASAATRVTVGIETLRSGCRLTLTQDDLPWEYASFARARWTGMFYGLGLTLDARDNARATMARAAEPTYPAAVRRSSVAASLRGCPRRCVRASPVPDRFQPGETPCNTC